MGLFIYAGPTERYYPDHPMPDGRGVAGIPGGEPVEMDAPPADGLWREYQPEKTPRTASKKTVKAAGEGPAEKEN